MPLAQVATVSVPEPRMLSVQVWDRALVQAVEDAAQCGRRRNRHARLSMGGRDRDRARLRDPKQRPERRLGRAVGTAGEWMHANSLSIGPRGNVLVSSHYLNQVLSLSPDWRRIEWRLGGPRATIAREEA